MATTMFVRHEVNDYKTWKSVYDGLGLIRKQSGVTTSSVHRDANDPNIIIITHQFKDMTAATSFANSGELKSAMGKAGLSGPPELWFSEDIEHTPF